MTDSHPYAGSYLDRHGKRRWRFRKGGRTVALPDPGHPAFQAAYEAALAGRPIARATVTRLPTAGTPRSMRAAFRILTTETIEWQRMDPQTQHDQRRIAERFLTSPVSEGNPLTFAELPIDQLRRKHVKAILARKADTPHAAAHLLRMIRKLTGVALDQDWIEVDPTYRIKFRPDYQGWKAWPAEARQQFEARWPPGTTPRTCYALALYFGHRRSDVATIAWADLEEDGGNTVQRKTGKRLWIPMHPELRLALEAAPRAGASILVTQYGRPFSAKALGMRMQDWTHAAGLPGGHTLHGLRKTLGKMLAESGATTRQIMAILGHDDIAHAELYTREAEQKLLANEGMEKIAGGKRLRTIKGGKS